MKNTKIRYIGLNNAPDVLKSIANGKTRFTDIMFDLKINPGILNRLLKAGREANLIEIENGNYKLTRAGSVVIGAIDTIEAL